MLKADALIRTKLHLPYTRPELVSRLRLRAQIAKGLSGPLTLVTAPAGFGKTTLVASTIVNCGMPVAWLSLDKDDNQVERFLSYLVAALQEANPGIGSGAAQHLEAARQAPPGAALTSLINDLDRVGQETALVLDDYQFISSQEVHDEVSFLLQHCPNKLHVVIASRSDPPLHIVSLRGRGKMVELRTADLRFTETEAAQFLNEVMGLNLTAGSVAMLEERTEGWIAGLQMAALSMHERKDLVGFIKGFSGTNRYILDYLIEEVMANQSREIQQFLLYTSILERLTASLCQAVLATGNLDGLSSAELPDNYQPPSLLSCQQSLEYLERANLFLVPLDDERTWYRYHHLFADLLRARLGQSLKIEEIDALHTRAAQWFIQNGLAYEAIHHASLTSNDEWVEQLIEQNYMEMFHRGEASAIRFWTGKLSKELIYRRPWLCIYEAQSHCLFGQLDEAEVLLAKAEEHLQRENPSADTRAMLGNLAYVKSRVTGMRGDVRQAIELSLVARENTPASNKALHSGIGVMLGVAYFLNGDFKEAIETYEETIEASSAANAINGTVAAYCHLARLYAIQGKLEKSYELYQKAEGFANTVGSRNLGVQSLVEVGIANVLYEQNELETALAHIKRGLELVYLWGNADDIALAYATHARILQAQGNLAGAREAIEKGIQVIQTNGVFSEAREAVWSAQVALWLSEGDLLSADHWVVAQQERLRGDTGYRFENELTRIITARVSLAEKKLDETLSLLTQLELSAEAGGRTERLIEILILKALTFQMFGETSLALAAVEKSLRMAEPEGYVQVFLIEGKPMQRVLDQWLRGAETGVVRDFAAHLVSHLEAETPGVTARQGRSTPGSELVEPLSQRELEVLRLLALGKTNNEIAEQLVVAQGTIKAHAASIYRKLNVTNRTEAVAQARALGILP
jgi:LuxR family maltose regulon positive regulatory protein